MPRLLTQADQSKIAMLHQADGEGRKQAHIDIVMQLAKTAARTMAWQQMMQTSNEMEKAAWMKEVGQGVAKGVGKLLGRGGGKVVSKVPNLAPSKINFDKLKTIFSPAAPQAAAPAQGVGSAVAPAVSSTAPSAASKAVRPAVDKEVLLSNLRSGGLAHPSNVAPSPFNPIVKDVGRAAAPASSAADAGRQALISNVQNRGLVRPSSNVAASPYNQGLSNVTQVTKPPLSAQAMPKPGLAQAPTQITEEVPRLGRGAQLGRAQTTPGLGPAPTQVTGSPLAAQPTQIMAQPGLGPAPTQVTGAPLAAQPTKVMTQPGLGPVPTQVTGPPLAAQPTQVMAKPGLGPAPTRVSPAGPIAVERTPLNEVSTKDIISGRREGVDRYFPVGPQKAPPTQVSGLQAPPTQAAAGGMAYEPTQIARLQAPPTQVTGLQAPSTVKSLKGPTSSADFGPTVVHGETQVTGAPAGLQTPAAAGAAPAAKPAFYSEAQRADAISGARKALASGKVPSSSVKQQWREKGIYDDIMSEGGKVRAAGPEIAYKGGNAEEAVERAFAQAKPAGPSKGGVGPIKVHGSESLKKRPSLESPKAGRARPITPTQGPVASGEISRAGTLPQAPAVAYKPGTEAAAGVERAFAKAAPAGPSRGSAGPINRSQRARVAQQDAAAEKKYNEIVAQHDLRKARESVAQPSLATPQAAGAAPVQAAAAPSAQVSALQSPQAAGAVPTAQGPRSVEEALNFKPSTPYQATPELSKAQQQMLERAGVTPEATVKPVKDSGAALKTPQEAGAAPTTEAAAETAAKEGPGRLERLGNQVKWGLIGGVGLPAAALAYGATQAAPAVAGALSANAQQPLSYGVGPNPGLTPNYM